MGQSINPVVTRLGIIRNFDSKWTASLNVNYDEILDEDLLIKNLLLSYTRNLNFILHRSIIKRQSKNIYIFLYGFNDYKLKRNKSYKKITNMQTLSNNFFISNINTHIHKKYYLKKYRKLFLTNLFLNIKNFSITSKKNIYLNSFLFYNSKLKKKKIFIKKKKLNNIILQKKIQKKRIKKNFFRKKKNIYKNNFKNLESLYKKQTYKKYLKILKRKKISKNHFFYIKFLLKFYKKIHINSLKKNLSFKKLKKISLNQNQSNVLKNNNFSNKKISSSKELSYINLYLSYMYYKLQKQNTLKNILKKITNTENIHIYIKNLLYISNTNKGILKNFGKFSKPFLKRSSLIIQKAIVLKSASLLGEHLRFLLQSNFNRQNPYRLNTIIWFFRNTIRTQLNKNNQYNTYLKNLGVSIILKGKFRKASRKQKRILNFFKPLYKQKKTSLLDFYLTELYTNFGALSLKIYVHGTYIEGFFTNIYDVHSSVRLNTFYKTILKNKYLKKKKIKKDVIKNKQSKIKANTKTKNRRKIK